MREESARDPYVGINRLIENRAEGTQRTWYAIGKVLCVAPLRIRADGIDLDEEDLRVPESLLPNFSTQAGRGILSLLPQAQFTGECFVWYQGAKLYGEATVTRPEEQVQGKAKLSAGDDVLLIRSQDGQIYYLVERMVKL